MVLLTQPIKTMLCRLIKKLQTSSLRVFDHSEITGLFKIYYKFSQINNFLIVKMTEQFTV